MHDQAEILRTVERLTALAPTGYAIALHVRFTTPTFLFQTYPREWIEVYTQRGYVMSDPTVMWGFSNTGRVRWSDLTAQDSAGMLAQSAAHGMKYGFTLATDRAGSQSLGSFTRGDRDFTDAEIDEIEGLFLGLHDATTDLAGLSPETRDALKLMSITFTHPSAG